MTRQELPEYAEPRRLHPLSMFYRGIVSAPAFIFVAVAGVSSRDQMFTIILSFIYVFLALPSIVFRYYFFRFAIDGREVMIESGVLSRRVRHIPLERIQNIEINQNFLQRILRIAQVHMETAGGSDTEGVLEFVSVSDAENIRQAIRRYQREILPQEESRAASPAVQREAASAPETAAQASPGAPVESAGEEADDEEELIRLRPRQVLIYGMTHLSLWFVAITAWVFQYANMTPEQIAIHYFGDQMNYLRSESDVVITVYIIGAVLAAILLTWVSGILFAYNKYHGFRLTIAGNKLHKQHGLLSLAKGTIPLKKLQMIVITSNPLMRRLGYRGVDVQTAGFGVRQQRGPEVAVPLVPEEQAVELARRMRRFDYPASFESVSPLTIRRAFVRYALALLIPGALVYFFLPDVVWLAIMLPLLYYAALLRYRHRGYRIAGDVVFIKHGFIWRRLSIIPIAKIQTLSVSATFFQRRLGLASLLVDTAGVSSMDDAGIIDIDLDDALRIQSELSEEFNRLQAERSAAKASAVHNRTEGGAEDTPAAVYSARGDSENAGGNNPAE